MAKKSFSEGELLLRGILTNPREDAPRLVYADWLDENAKGQPDKDRAEFIRLGIEFYHYDREINGGNSKERNKLTDRIHTLFLENAKTRKWPEYNGVYTWEQDCNVQVDGVLAADKGGGCRIRRGFPYWLNYRCGWLVKDIGRWFKQFPITVVYLQDRDPEYCLESSYRWVKGYSAMNGATLPKPIYDLMPSDWEYKPEDIEGPDDAREGYKDYFSGVREAEEAAMIGCIRLGKKRAGLPYGLKDMDLFA